MANEARCKIVDDNGGHRIRIPARMMSDSQYPFNIGEKVKITLIPNEGLMIKRDENCR